MSFYKKLGKNFIAFALCVFALFLLAPASANAAEVTVSSEAELLSAIQSAGTADANITITNDIELTADTVIPSNISISSDDTEDYWIWWSEDITVENQGYIDYVQAEGGKLINNGACYAVVCYGGEVQINTYVAKCYVYMGTTTVSTNIGYAATLDTGCLVVANGGSVDDIAYQGGKIVNNSGADIQIGSTITLKNGETYEVASEIIISDGKTSENAITGGTISAAGGYTYDSENAEIVIKQDNLTVSGLSQGIAIAVSGDAVKKITLDGLTLTGDAAFYQKSESTVDLTVVIKNDVTVPYFTLAGTAPVTIKGTTGSYLTSAEITSVYTDLTVEDLIGEVSAGITSGYYASGDLHVNGKCDIKSVCESLYDQDSNEYYSFPGLMAMGKIYFNLTEGATVTAAGGDAAFWYGENDTDYFEPSTAIFALDGFEFADNNTIVSPASFKVEQNNTGYYISSNGTSAQTVTIAYKSGSTPVVPVTKYSVSYSDPTFSAAPTDSNKYEVGASVTVLAPKRTEVTSNGTTYKFDGWSYNGKTYSAGDKLIMPDSDVTLTAVWSATTNPPTPATKYTVTYKDSYTTAPTDANEYEAGATVKVLAPAKTEVTVDGKTYVFAGWKYGSKTYNAGDTFAMPASNVVLEAVWNLKNTPVDPTQDQITGTITVRNFEKEYEITVVLQDENENSIYAEVTYAGNGVYNYKFNNVSDGEYYLYVESIDADNVYIDDAFILVDVVNGSASSDDSFDLKCFTYTQHDLSLVIKPEVDDGFSGKLHFDVSIGFVLDDSDVSDSFWFDPDEFVLDLSAESFMSLDAGAIYPAEYAIMITQSADDNNYDKVTYIITFGHDDDGNFYYNVYKDGVKIKENVLISDDTDIELIFNNKSSVEPPVAEPVIVVNGVEYTVDEFKGLEMAENQIGWSLNENSTVADFDINNIPADAERIVVYPVFKSVDPTPSVELTIEVRYSDGRVVTYTVDEFKALTMAENQIGWSTTFGSTVADFDVDKVAEGTEKVVVYPVFKQTSSKPDDGKDDDNKNDPIPVDPSKPSDDKPVDIDPSNPPSKDNTVIPSTGDANVAFAYAAMALMAICVAFMACRKKKEEI